MTNRYVCGAIHAVVTHPSNPDIVYLGAVNGGVWKTVNATAANPTWTTTTDNMPSLSIGALAFDSLDVTGNTLWAGTGRFSSYGQRGGSRSGILKTTDGGTTWTVVDGGGTIVGKNISGIVVRGSTVLVSVNTADASGNANRGVWRSTDGGAVFTQMAVGDGSTTGLPEGICYDIVSSPSAPNTVYACIAFPTTAAAKGIYKSVNLGASWARVSSAQLDGFITTSTSNIEMSVGSSDNVFVGILESGAPVAIFSSADGGTTWVKMDQPTMPVATATVHTVTGATNATPIVITTAAAHGYSTNNYIEIAGVTGNTGANGIFQITVVDTTTFSLDFSAGSGAYAAGGTARLVTSSSPKGVKGPETGAPDEIAGGQGNIHFSILADPSDPSLVYMGGDRQDLPFPNYIGAGDYSGNLWRGDTDLAPNGLSPSSQWKHLTHSNSVAGIPGGGTSNNSSPHADSRDMAIDAAGNLIEVDDGGIFRRTNPQSNVGAWTSMAGNLQITEAHNVAYDTVSNVIITGNQDNGTSVQNSDGSLAYSAVSTGDGGDVAAAVNPSNSSQSIRYSSFQNLGSFRKRVMSNTNTLVTQTFPALSPQGGAPAISGQFTTPVEINVINANRLIIGASNGVYESTDQGATVSRVSTLSPNSGGDSGRTMVYGGRKSGADNAEVIYFADGSGVYRRVTAGATPVAVAGYTGSTVRSITLDSEDYDHLFAIDNNQVFRSTDGGATFTDITGDLPAEARDIRCLEFIRSGLEWAVVVGTLRGVYAARYTAVTDWALVGSDMPNASVWDMDYDAPDNLLVVSTLGRGVWKFGGARDIAIDPAGQVPEIVVEQPPGSDLVDGVSTVNFGDIPTTVGTVRTFTVRNVGSANLLVSGITKDGANNSDLTLGSISASTVAPGSSATFAVTFLPGGLGPRSAAIHIASNDDDEPSFDIGVSANGVVGFPEIVIEQPAATERPDSAAIVDFGVAGLAIPVSKAFTIRNTGAADLTLSAVTVDGADAASFVPGAPSTTTISPAGSATLQVTFTPSAQGVRTAVLHVTSNDPDESPYDINLHGIGSLPAGPVSLVRDIGVAGSGGLFGNLVLNGGSLYYGYVGQLWKTNGTEAGTSVVNTATTALSGLTLVGTTLFYSGTDPTNGAELWSSNGTTAAMVTNIAAGLASSSPAQLVAAGSTLFFTANDSVNGVELWKSNGTAVGTTMVANINAGSASSSPTGLVAVGSMVYFAATDATNGTELWKSDGTTGGTVMIANINPGSASSSPGNLTVIGTTVYFTATNGTNGVELWKTDGTAGGTQMVLDIVTGSSSSTPLGLAVSGSTLYFRASSSTGSELWKSDGTAGGTVLVKDINAGSSSSTPSNITTLGSTIYFSATDSTNGTELWKSDGTSAGTLLVKDINAGSGASNPSLLTVVGSTLYFYAGDTTAGSELWKTDGTTAGTVRVEDINLGTSGALISTMAALGGTLIFNASDGVTGLELWRSDGTAAGTSLVRDAILGNNGSSPTGLTAIGSTLYFAATDTILGTELFQSDGTTAGTQVLKDIATGSSSPANITLAGTTMYFSANNGTNGNELWKSDGTSGGTVLVADINPGTSSSSPSLLRVMGGTLFFAATGSTANGQELWMSDGSSGGTVMVKNINPTASAGSSIASPLVVGSQLFFSANDGTNGAELWSSDGTLAGTVMVKNINPAAGTGSSISLVTAVGSTVFFSANDGVNGQELWKSDGTDAGTVMVKDINPGASSSVPASLFSFGGLLYFAATDGVNGTELWVSDGTTSGTVMLKDISPGAGGSSPAALTIYNGLLYFSAADSFGSELWRTDGTAGGTVQVRDINAGTASSSPTSLAAAGGQLYFRATTASHGAELWRTDGTSGGTQLVADIAIGGTSSTPGNIVQAGTRLYFTATAPGLSAELFSLALDSVPEIAVYDGVDVTGDERADEVGTFDFGARTTPTTRSFTLKNTGAGYLYVSDITVSGPGAGSFLVAGKPSPSLPIQPGSTVTFTVTATLEGPITQNAVVSILSNDADEGSFDIPVTVEVLDVTPPMISAPATYLVGQAGSLSMSLPDITGIVVYADNLPGEGSISQSPLPGAATLGVGQSVSVSFTATDPSGNLSNTVTTTVKMGLGQPNTGELAWAQSGFGVGSEGTVSRVVATPDGGALVAGSFLSSPFTLGAGLSSVTLTSAGASDVFIAKFSKEGVLEWARGGGGGTSDAVTALQLLADGSVALAGTFSGSALFSGVTVTGGGGSDAFIARYLADGTLAWAKGFGGIGTETIVQIAQMAGGEVVATGSFSSTATMTLAPGVTLANIGGAQTDLFVTKHQLTDGVPLWARALGSSTTGENTTGLSIAGASDGGVLIAGTLQSATTSITGSATTISNVSSDWMAVKFDANGSVLWAKNAGGGALGDSLSVMRLLATGDIILAGTYSSTTATFGAGGASPQTFTNAGSSDVTILRLSGATGSQVWAKRVAGLGQDLASSLLVLPDDSVVMAGTYANGSVQMGEGELGATTLTAPTANAKVFLARFGGSDGTLRWAKTTGGLAAEAIAGLALLGSGDVGLAGNFTTPSVVFGPGEANAATLTNLGTGTDVFVAKFSRADGGLAWAKSGGGANSDVSHAFTALANGSALLVGSYQPPSITFGSGEAGQVTLVNADTSGTITDLFFARFHGGGVEPPATPLVDLLPPTGLSPSTLTFSTSIDSRGQNTAVFVDYGPTTSYGTTVQLADVPAGLVPATRSLSLSSLAPLSTLNFRVRATNTEGTTTSENQIITTYPDAEIVVEQPEGTGLADDVSAVSFGTVALGASDIRVFTIRNAGLTGSLTGLAVTKDGPAAGDFTVGALGATTLAPGASTTFSITYNPSVGGARSAAIHIASNDGDENPFDLNLSGDSFLQAAFPSSGSVPVSAPSGYVVPSGRNLAVTLGFAPPSGTVLTVVNNGSTSPILGTFNDLPQGGIIAASFGGQTYLFRATYTGGDGNDLTLVLAYDWTWMKGSNSASALATYGTLGTPAAANTPGGRSGSMTWTDAAGDLWLFGGFTGAVYYSDLWKWSRGAQMWAWIKGSNLTSVNGVYGTQGVAAATNVPGARQGGATWIDSQGRLWLFGGFGLGASGATAASLNDLWRFDPASNNWTWISGSSATGSNGTYATMLIPSPSNMPGARQYASAWIDGTDSLWMFGGNGLPATGTTLGNLNDLWRFDPTLGQWAWMKGGTVISAFGTYGTKGIENSANVPGTRSGAAAWRDREGRLWLFGGIGHGLNISGSALGDLWRFNTTTLSWTWMSGSAQSPSAVSNGIYGSQAVPSDANRPGYRYYAAAWTDQLGRFWLHGGVGSGGQGATTGQLSDLWMYDLASNRWSWIKGPQSLQGNGAYGVQGAPNVGNLPGARQEPGSFGMASSGYSKDPWLFGGLGYPATGVVTARLNDLWTLDTPDVLEVTTIAATGVDDAGATISGTASPGGTAASGYFRVSTSPDLAGAVLTSVQALGSGASPVPFSQGLSGLAPGTTYYFAAVAANGIDHFFGPILSFTTLTKIEAWRLANFGSANNTGLGANTGDWDSDGVLNLFEFAFGTNPNLNTSGPNLLVTTGGLAGGALVSTGQPITMFGPVPTGTDYRAVFIRRKDYVAAGLTYTPQFSANLVTWVNSTATPTVLADDGTYQAVSVPYPFFIGGKKARFFRISVTINP